LHAINRLQQYYIRKKKAGAIITGEIYSHYRELAKAAHYTPLTQRRVADFLFVFDALGIITARVISKGRYGRTTEIAVSSTELAGILQDDELFEEIEQVKMKNQMKLL
jgi:cell division control protein 6